MSDEGGRNPFDHRGKSTGEPRIPVNFSPEQTGVFAEPGAYEAALTHHVDTTVGPHSDLFHEALGLDLHLDVLMVPPGPNRQWFTLVTCGMGHYEMKMPPEEGRHKSRMELAICLPPDWEPFHTYDTPLSGHNERGMRIMEGMRFTDNDPPVTPYGPGGWIMGALNFTAKVPVRYDTWFDEGHTIPNGDPPEPVIEGSELCCTMLARPRRIGNPYFHKLKLDDGSIVRIMSLILITRPEMDFKLRKGWEALMEKLDEKGIDELLDLGRAGVCRGGLLGFLGF